MNVISTIIPKTIPMTIDQAVHPISLDFTADIEMLPYGSDPAVTYVKRHFHFAIPEIGVSVISTQTINNILNGTYTG